MSKKTSEENEELKNAKNRFDELLNTIGWKRRQFAYEFSLECPDYHDDDHGCEKFYEKLKKQLERETTKVSVIEGYIAFILNHEAYKKRNYELLPELDLSSFDEQTQKMLDKIGQVSAEFFKRHKI